MSPQQVGAILDNLGVVADIEEGDLVAGAVVILKVHPADGQPGLVLALDDTSDWITQRGMLSAAWDIVRLSADVEEDE